MTRLTAAAIAFVVSVFAVSIAEAQTFEPRPISKNPVKKSFFLSVVAVDSGAAAAAAPAAATQQPILLPQAGVEFGNQDPTISVQAIRLHVQGHPEFKFYVLSAVPVVATSIPDGETLTSKPAERLQRALSDAAGGLANVGFARQVDAEFISADVRGGAKLVEVPDTMPGAAPVAGSTGYTVRLVASGAAKFELRIPLQNEANEAAGSVFANATAVYNYLQDDVAARFDVHLKHHNFNLNGSAGIDIPTLHFYVAAVFSMYANDDQFGSRFAVTFNPHR